MLKYLFVSPVEESLKKNNIQFCYLFGSQSTLESNALSDYDIALFMDDKHEIDYKKILKEVFDKFIYPEKLHLSIVDLKNTSPLFLYQIIKSGTLLYEEKPYRSVGFEALILRLYFDDQHRNSLYFNALHQKYENR